MSDIATKLEDQLTCAICLEQFKDPRSLSCLHSFCTGCLEKLFHEDETVLCPSCRATTRISQGKITTLPIAFHVNNLLEVQDLLRKSSKSEAVCANCPQEKAKFYCPECEDCLCNTCNDIHKKWRAFSSHEVMGIEEVANKAIKLVSEKPMKCPSHKDPLKVYCIKCDQPMCYFCTIKDHKGHDHTLVDDAYEECKQKIREKLKLLEKNVEQRRERTKEMEERKKKVQEKATKGHKANINQLCDDFVEKIEEIRRLGLQAVEGGMASYSACKDQQIEKEEAKIQALYDCKEHVESSLEKSSSIQLLLMKKQIMERFEEIVVPSKAIKPVAKPKPDIADESSSSSDEEVKALWLYYPLIQHSKPPKVPKNASNDLTIINLMNSIFSFALLEYPELVREQCEVWQIFQKKLRSVHHVLVHSLCFLRAIQCLLIQNMFPAFWNQALGYKI